MFRDTIKGLDRIFYTDIRPPKVILITGPPGSLKSAFVYSVLTKYLEQTGEFGLYVTLEESVDSHLENMESLGINFCFNLQISDFNEIRGEDELEIDYLEFTRNMIEHFKRKKGEKFTCFAFDSLGALYSLMSQENLRRKMYHFFRILRDHNLYSFIIMERDPNGPPQLLGNEGFLSDGIILLGLHRSQGKLTRFIQVEKMRAAKHAMERYSIDVREDGLYIMGPLFDTD